MKIRIGMTVVLVSRQIHWIQRELESVWEWSLFSRYTIYNVNYNRYDCGPRFPSALLNTVKIKISMTVVFVSYRIHWIQWKLDSAWQCFSFPTRYIEYSEIRMCMTAVPVFHWIHWIQRELESVWHWSSFPTEYIDYSENWNMYDSGLRSLSDNYEFSEN